MNMRNSLRLVISIAALLLPIQLFGQPWIPGTGGIVYNGGNVGIGPSITAPQSLLHIAGSGGAGAIQFDTPGPQSFRFTTLPGIFNWGGLTLNGKYNSGWYLDDTAHVGYFLKLDGRASDTVSTGMWLYVIPAGSNPHTNEYPAFGVTTGTMYMNGTASIGGFSGGVAPAPPADTLRVYGSIRADGAITGASVIGAAYQDVAEWVPAAGTLQPGTVVVLDPDTDNQVMESAHAYDTTVAGVVSAQPGVLLGQASDNKAKIATTGRVKVLTDATKHPVKIGDLLVTSDEPGSAMVSVPVDVNGVKMHRPGTLIGKALEPLANGKREILVLLSLQ